MSNKTRARNILWKKITAERIMYLRNKYGRTLCEFCGKYGTPFLDSPSGLWGHHLDGNRNNCVPSNCYIAHNAPCHDKIQQEHLKVKQEGFEGKEEKDEKLET